MFDSQTSNLQRYIVEAEQKLKQAKSRLKEINKKIEADKAGLAKLTEQQKFKLYNGNLNFQYRTD